MLAVAILLSSMITGEVERPRHRSLPVILREMHQETGTGETGKFPKLAGNSIVLSENATSLIRLLLEGSKTAHTRTGPEPQEMPSFAEKLSDRQIARCLASFAITGVIRRHGDDASGVIITECAAKETVTNYSIGPGMPIVGASRRREINQ